MRLELKPVPELSDDERRALKALSAAVYPAQVTAASPGRHLKWAPPDYGVLVWDETGSLVSYVGLLVRAGSLDDSAVRIGGIGSVKTHPHVEGRGYASAAIRLATAALNDDHRVEFSRDHLLPFYSRFGWLDFRGRLVLAGWRPAPRDGTIDLNGAPW